MTAVLDVVVPVYNEEVALGPCVRRLHAHLAAGVPCDNDWFFDTELLVLAQRAGLRIHEVPVDWVDDPDSRVDIVATALADLRGIARLARDPLRQLARFMAVGIASTVAYLALFAGLRLGLPAQPANVLALLTTAVANTAANRRLTVGVRGRRDAVRHQLQGLFVFGLGLGLTSGSLALLHAVAPVHSRTVELAVVTAANLVATVLRFVLLRAWLSGDARRVAEPVPYRPERRLGPGCGARLAEQVRHVDGDRADRDAERAGHLLVRHTGGQARQYFTFSRGQPGDPGPDLPD
jgi:putative flippase GtrA